MGASWRADKQLAGVIEGFESPPAHVLTEEQKKELDEMAKRFKDTLGGGK